MKTQRGERIDNYLYVFGAQQWRYTRTFVLLQPFLQHSAPQMAARFYDTKAGDVGAFVTESSVVQQPQVL